MLNQRRFVVLGMGMFTCLVSVRPAVAQPLIQISSVNVQGRFDTAANCPGRTHDPEAMTFARTDLAPIVIMSQAVTSGGVCSARGTSQSTITFYQTTSGALQISGTTSTGTLGSVLAGGGKTEFATSTASSETTIEIGLTLSRWCSLSIAGIMSIGSVTAVGSPEYSTALMNEWWDLTAPDGREIVLRSIVLGSEDTMTQIQDVDYRTFTAGPGMYMLRLHVSGEATGDLQQMGVTGSTCAGNFGLSVAAERVCVADFDQDGTLDSRDFFEFLNAFFLEAADFNQDSFVDSRDFFDFLSAYLEGCWW